MAVKVQAPIEPYNDTYPVARAQHIEMPDGSRLSEFKGSLPIKGAPQIGQLLRVAELDAQGNVVALESAAFSANIIFMTQEEYDTYKNSAAYDPNQTVAICTEDTAV